MTKSAEQAAEEVLSAYEREIASIKTANAPLVAELVAEIEAAGEDAVSDFFFDQTDSTKSHLGMDAANMLERGSDQEEAISRVEKWVADNVANAGWETNVANLIWGSGPAEGAAMLRSEIGANAAPSA